MVTVAVTGLLGAALVTYLTLVNNQNQMVMRSQTWNICMPVLEAGIEEALTHCERNYQTNMVSNGWVSYNGAYIKSNAIGDGYFLTAISQSLPYEIVSSGYVPMPGSSTMVSRRVKVTTEPLGVFSGSLIVRNTINMNGNNVGTDSYDSTDPAKSTNGQYDPAKAGHRGDVGCMGGLRNSFRVGNADIKGHVMTGPVGAVNIGPNGIVGNTSWHSSGSSGIQPGWWLNDLNISFPEVEEPYAAAVPPISGDFNGETYDYVLTDGRYELSSLSGAVVVTGEATLYVKGDVVFSSTDKLQIAPGGSLNLYVSGTQTKLTTVVNETGNAASFRYYGLPTNKEVTMSGSATMTGAIYAPDAKVTLTGGVDFYGSIVADAATLNGHSQFHYDEALANVGPRRAIAVASWNEL